MALPISNPGNSAKPEKGLPVPKSEPALPRPESALPLPPPPAGLPRPKPAEAPQAPRRQVPPQRPAAPPQAHAAPRVNPLDAIDFKNTPLNKIRLSDYNVNVLDLPIFQHAVGLPTAKNYVRELRLVKDDNNPRGPVVADPKSGRLFRQLPKSEFAGEDPVLTVDDFNTEDLNSEAAALLGHLQVTTGSEAREIALRRKGISNA